MQYLKEIVKTVYQDGGVESMWECSIDGKLQGYRLEALVQPHWPAPAILNPSPEG